MVKKIVSVWQKTNGTWVELKSKDGSELINTSFGSTPSDSRVPSEKLVYNTCLKKSDVVNNLTSTATDKPLSAYQGKTLNDTCLKKSDVVDSFSSTETDKPLSANKGKWLYDNRYIPPSMVSTDVNPDDKWMVLSCGAMRISKKTYYIVMTIACTEEITGPRRFATGADRILLEKNTPYQRTVLPAVGADSDTPGVLMLNEWGNWWLDFKAGSIAAKEHIYVSGIVMTG